MVNLATEALIEKVNATGTNFPAELSEFEEVGWSPSRASAFGRHASHDSPAPLNACSTGRCRSATRPSSSGVSWAPDRAVVLTDGRPGRSAAAAARAARRQSVEPARRGRRARALPYEQWPGSPPVADPQEIEPCAHRPTHRSAAVPDLPAVGQRRAGPQEIRARPPDARRVLGLLPAELDPHAPLHAGAGTSATARRPAGHRCPLPGFAASREEQAVRDRRGALGSTTR